MNPTDALSWLREVPQRIRAHGDVRLAMKLMNARFDDDFQLEMMDAASDAGVPVVLSEDFQDGREIEGVRFVNPFRPT